MTGITVNVGAGASVTGSGAGGTGIVLDGTNAINNSGTVTGVSNGIVATTGNIIVNTGTITGTSSRGIQVTNNNTITNSNTITGAQTGIQLNTNNTVNNTGTISGTANGIISNATPNTNVINNDGTISSSSGNGISAFGTVANTGTISGVTAINSTGPGSVTITNSSTGIISGAPTTGLNATINFGASGVATITNDGTIRVTTAQGTAIAASNATITNNATGSISGKTNGISITGGAGTGSVTNSGTIQATGGTGVIFTLGGTVTNHDGGVITGGGGTGVQFTGATASTFTNHGTVNGAVNMSTGNDTITLGTASVITGAIDGRGGTNTMELGASEIAGGPTTGILSSTLSNITTLTVNAVGSTWVVTGSGTPTGGTTISIGTLQLGNGGAAGDLGGDVVNNDAFAVNRSDTYTFAGAISGTGSFAQMGPGTTILTGVNTYSGGTTVSAGTLQGDTTSLQGNITNNATLVFDQAAAGTYGGVVSGTGTLTKQGAGTLTLSNANTYSGGTTVNAGTLMLGAGASLLAGSALTINGGTFDLDGNDQTVGALSGTGGILALGSGTLTAGDATNTTLASAITGTGALVKQGSGTLILTGANTYSGGTTVSAGTLQGNTTSLQGDITNNAALVFDQAAVGTYAGIVSGTGSLTKQGAGTLTLTGANTYSGGTAVNVGTLQGGAANAFSANSAVTVASGATLDLNNFSQSIGSLAGAGTVSLGSALLTTGNDGTSTTFSGAIAGTGGLTKIGSGTLSLTGVNTYTGATAVDGGMLSVNGSLASSVTVNSGGTLGGTGTVGGLTVAGGIVAPGNSIGTLAVGGNFVQNGGTYQVEVNAAGQSDRINVGGTATINGGTVQVLPQPGTYARNTTYTILNATGGVSGAYSTVTSNFAFLTPSLSYDANNVYLLLAQSQTAFENGGWTANQRSVGRALDQANSTATGDFNTVLNALSALSTQQGPGALDQLSGQAYGGFAVTSSKASQLFMNQLGQQMAAARGVSAGTTRVALAEACDTNCEDGTTAAPWSAWFNGVGALGRVSGDGNTHTATYSIGGVAAGVDYRIDPQLLVGLGVGYSKASLWLDGFGGNGSSDGLQVALYSGFTAGAVYLDGVAGYAYSGNQLQRPIFIPGLQTRTATGSPQANQLFGQLEGGYRFDLDSAMAATLTPFARWQAWTGWQGAFSEGGANSISLNVAQQNTTSVRSIIGAELAGSTDLGWLGRLALQLRLGWAHEYADVAYPVTASFAGAPFAGFIVTGATLPRDSAILGLLAQTAIAEAASLYLRYDGELGGGINAHALTLGVRISW